MSWSDLTRALVTGMASTGALLTDLTTLFGITTWTVRAARVQDFQGDAAWGNLYPRIGIIPEDPTIADTSLIGCDTYDAYWDIWGHFHAPANAGQDPQLLLYAAQDASEALRRAVRRVLGGAFGVSVYGYEVRKIEQVKRPLIAVYALAGMKFSRGVDE